MKNDDYGIVDILMPYTEEEELYRQYRMLKNPSAERDAFLKSLTPGLRYDVEGIDNQTKKAFTLCDAFVFFDKTQNVHLEKHKRFSPASPHDHTFFELVYLLKGNCKNCIGDKLIDMRENDLCILPPGVIHSLEVLDESLVINILVRNSVISEILFNLSDKTNVLIKQFCELMYNKTSHSHILFHIDSNLIIKNLIEILITEEYINKGDSTSDPVKRRLLEVVFFYLLRAQSEDRNNYQEKYSEDPRVIEIMNYVRHNYENATLRSVAVHLNYTEQHLSRLLKKKTGLNFKNILTNIRLQKACELLRETDLKILNISFAVGYKNPGYFNVMFRDAMNETPRSYREKFKKRM